MARSLRLSGWCEFKDARIWLTLLSRISAANSGPNLFHQKLSRFMADVDTAFVQKVLDIPECKRKPNIHHDVL
jgi:hypothetical protein